MTYCTHHMPEGWPGNGHYLSGSRDCAVVHAECVCTEHPRYITQGCPQHHPYRESTD